MLRQSIVSREAEGRVVPYLEESYGGTKTEARKGGTFVAVTWIKNDLII